jgi:hypothetical protein
VISPLLPQGGNLQRCLVKHVLTVDWKHWNTCWSPACDKDITLHVLERVASIREMYKVKPADYKPIPTLVETERWKVKGGKPSHEDGQFDAKKGKQHGNALRDDHVEPKVSTFLKLADDEFYDVPEDSSWEQDHDPELESQNVQSESEGTSDEDKVSASQTILHCSFCALQDVEHESLFYNRNILLRVGSFLLLRFGYLIDVIGRIPADYL